MESKSWKVDLFITEMNGTVGTIIAICLALLISDIFSLKIQASWPDFSLKLFFGQKKDPPNKSF